MSADPARSTDLASPPAPPTGHARVDAVLDRAAELDLLPVAEHPARYEELHAVLVAELSAEPGTVPAGPAPGGGPGAGPSGQGPSGPR
ncbi:hypothetical protein ACFYE2_04200 [Kocuria sp. CPCC 205300]|uniref:hypothetical protein n=1 Tax=Kocuria sabuli TaxID=3071448 RepID=UPI0036DAE99C